jgi:hypothetical protein
MESGAGRSRILPGQESCFEGIQVGRDKMVAERGNGTAGENERVLRKLMEYNGRCSREK